jgi:shikimate dehydrogenase
VSSGPHPSLRTGLIGAGIGGSLSPALHISEADAQGISLTYTRFDTGADPRPLADVLRAAADAGFAGVNITHPHKQAVLPLLDGVTQHARELGAVNTVLFEAGRMTGHNTDGPGYADAFVRQMAGADTRRVVQCGAGGAGAAVAHAQLDLGVEHLVLHDPHPTRRQALVADLVRRFRPDRVSESAGDLAHELARATGLVNASPVGMAAHPGVPVPVSALHPGLWVSEVVYMPIETHLLRAARARGLRTLSGVHMCVHQAARAFELFTGLAPDLERMLDHLGRVLGEREETVRA